MLAFSSVLSTFNYLLYFIVLKVFYLEAPSRFSISVRASDNLFIAYLVALLLSRRQFHLKILLQDLYYSSFFVV